MTTLSARQRAPHDKATFKVEHICDGVAVLVPKNELARDAMGQCYGTTRSVCDSSTVRERLERTTNMPGFGYCGVSFL
jgi:hypothetical protein